MESDDPLPELWNQYDAVVAASCGPHSVEKTTKFLNERNRIFDEIMDEIRRRPRYNLQKTTAEIEEAIKKSRARARAENALEKVWR